MTAFAPRKQGALLKHDGKLCNFKQRMGAACILAQIVASSKFITVTDLLVHLMYNSKVRALPPPRLARLNAIGLHSHCKQRFTHA